MHRDRQILIVLPSVLYPHLSTHSHLKEPTGRTLRATVRAHALPSSRGLLKILNSKVKIKLFCVNIKPILFQLGLLKILQCHRGESPDRRGSGGSGRSSSGSADSFQVSIHKFFIWEFYYICSALEFLSLFGALTTFLGSSLFFFYWIIIIRQPYVSLYSSAT